MQFSKVIDYEDFYSEELAPYLQAIAKDEMAFFGSKTPTIIPDSKNWETAMALYSFEKNDILKEGKLFAGIGAGTEHLTEYLANKGAVVFPTDRYLESTAWSDVAPGGYMVDASSYARRCLKPENIIPVHSDARALKLPSSFFDGVYSSGSIEHFGGVDAVEAAAAEIGRILKPGGIASISTEFRLDGPEHLAWFDDHCLLFTPQLLEKHIIKPSGLIPIGVLNNQPSPKTFQTRKELVEFLNSAKTIRSFEDKVDVYPNLVLFHAGFLFCSVHLLLKKPLDWKPAPTAIAKVESFYKEIEVNNQIAIRRLGTALSVDDFYESVSEHNGIKKSRISRALSRINFVLSKKPLLRRCIVRFLYLIPGVMVYLRRKSKGYC